MPYATRRKFDAGTTGVIETVSDRETAMAAKARRSAGPVVPDLPLAVLPENICREPRPMIVIASMLGKKDPAILRLMNSPPLAPEMHELSPGARKEDEWRGREKALAVALP